MKDNMFEKEKIENMLMSLHLKGTIVDKKKGTYGVVFIVDNGENVHPRYVAYKTIETTKEQFEEEKLRNFVREARQWFKVKGHVLVLTPFYITYFRDLPLICMPFCEMDLQTYLEKHERLDLTETLVFATQILKGLIVAKSKGIEAHQDLKPGNILLEDLSLKFNDFPHNDLHPSIRFRVRIADFGLANAWKELGKPQGTWPYMAPEQFPKSQYEHFNPDIFAVGVMMAEMLTGKHPCGKATKEVWPNGWGKWDWRRWAKEGERIVRIGDDEDSNEIETLINNMLQPNPENRPSFEDTLNKIITILSRISKPTSEQLTLLFEYYDTWSGYMEREQRLEALTQLSQMPKQLDIVISELFEELRITERELDSPRQVVYFCGLCYGISKMLLRRGKEEDKEKVKQFAERIIFEASKWRDEIKTRHKYLELKFKGKYLVKTPPFRDFEVYSDIIGYGKNLLENIIGSNGTEDFFVALENYTQSAYYFNIASDFHSNGDEKKAVEVLDKCIKLNSTEAAFYYTKALWTEYYLITGDALRKLETQEKDSLRKVIRENAQKALQIDPSWEEPRKLIEGVEK